MTKSRPRRERSVLDVELPERPELATVEPMLESLNDLAARRDTLRLIAERAGDEADRIDRELRTALDHAKRQLASTAAQLGQVDAP